jgi:hypothetical protein
MPKELSKEELYKGRLAGAFWVCVTALIISAIFINDYKKVTKTNSKGKEYDDREFIGYNSVAITFTTLFGLGMIFFFVVFVRAPAIPE